jgi:hypothetical protein
VAMGSSPSLCAVDTEDGMGREAKTGTERNDN